MSAIKLNSSGGGSITISPASTASTLTLTAPAQTGTIGIQGPAFSAYAISATNTATATWTKIVLNAEEFDTANCFNTSTYAFTPNVAGYYQINACIFSGSLPATMGIALYKNGAQFKTGALSSGATAYRATVAALIYLNGTTDYVDAYWYQASGVTVNSTAGAEFTYLQGCLVRGA